MWKPIPGVSKCIKYRNTDRTQGQGEGEGNLSGRHFRWAVLAGRLTIKGRMGVQPCDPKVPLTGWETSFKRKLYEPGIQGWDSVCCPGPDRHAGPRVSAAPGSGAAVATSGVGGPVDGPPGLAGTGTRLHPGEIIRRARRQGRHVRGRADRRGGESASVSP